MSHVMKTLVVTAAIVTIGGALVWAHQMTVKGTVAGIETSRVQIKTGEEQKGVIPAWYPIDAKTKILRGKDVVTFAQAKIAVGERVVATVDHESSGKMRTIDLRLAQR